MFPVKPQVKVAPICLSLDDNFFLHLNTLKTPRSAFILPRWMPQYTDYFLIPGNLVYLIIEKYTERIWN